MLSLLLLIFFHAIIDSLCQPLRPLIFFELPLSVSHITPRHYFDTFITPFHERQLITPAATPDMIAAVAIITPPRHMPPYATPPFCCHYAASAADSFRFRQRLRQRCHCH